MKKILSRADELVLLSVWRLQGEAYGVTIRKNIMEATNQEWSVGAIYDSLERLQNWDYLRSFQSNPTPERGGKRKRFYELTDDGVVALNELKKVQDSMWQSLPNLGTETS